MTRKGKQNPFFDDFQMRSMKLIRLSICIQNYRRHYNLSQREMADICTLYGEPVNVKFFQTEIANYENCKTVPTPPKFQVLMNTMNIDESVLQ
jgi:transcriptional regulator with XRE-family HTH domain